jgi:hypothetical protein
MAITVTTISLKAAASKDSPGSAEQAVQEECHDGIADESDEHLRRFR